MTRTPAEVLETIRWGGDVGEVQLQNEEEVTTAGRDLQSYDWSKLEGGVGGSIPEEDTGQATPLVINIDLDGVLSNLMPEVVTLGSKYLGRELPYPTTWHVWKEWGITKNEFWGIMYRGVTDDALFERPAPVAGALSAVNKLHKGGHRLRVVTSKLFNDRLVRELAMKQTVTWLAEWDLLGKVELAFATNKQGYTADVVIDDKPSLEWAQKGAANILFHQPWNYPFITIEPNRGPLHWRAMGWDDVLGIIDGL